MKCAKCEKEMQEGFIGDKSTFDTQVRQTWGTGIKILGSGMDNSFPVTTYRCKTCGYLESYTK